MDTSFDSFFEHYHQHHLSPDSVLSRSLSVDSSSSRPFIHSLRPKASPWRPTSLNASPLFSSAPSRARQPLHKYLCFWVPLYKKVKALRWGAAAAATAAKEDEEFASARSRSRSSSRSRKSESFSRVDYCCRPNNRVRAFDAGVEKSIHEAVLHCKKSIGRVD